MLKITIETSEDDGLIEDIHISFKYVEGKRRVSTVDTTPNEGIFVKRDTNTIGTINKPISDRLSSINEEDFLTPSSKEDTEVEKPIIPDIKDRVVGEVPAEMLEQF